MSRSSAAQTLRVDPELVRGPRRPGGGGELVQHPVDDAGDDVCLEAGARRPVHHHLRRPTLPEGPAETVRQDDGRTRLPVGHELGGLLGADVTHRHLQLLGVDPL
nr:hypothetical protein [Serinicoccus marinus]